MCMCARLFPSVFSLYDFLNLLCLKTEAYVVANMQCMNVVPVLLKLMFLIVLVVMGILLYLFYSKSDFWYGILISMNHPEFSILVGQKEFI